MLLGFNTTALAVMLGIWGTIIAIATVASWWRKPPASPPPWCRRCGYSLHGQGGRDTCPECGVDLRRHGIRRPPPPVRRFTLLALAWTAGLAMTLWSFHYGFVRTLAPIEDVWEQEAVVSIDQEDHWQTHSIQQLENGIRLQTRTTAKRWGHQSPTVATTTASHTTAHIVRDGKPLPPRLHFDPQTNTFEIRDESGHLVHSGKPLNVSVLRAWLTQAGVPDDRDTKALYLVSYLRRRLPRMTFYQGSGISLGYGFVFIWVNNQHTSRMPYWLSMPLLVLALALWAWGLRVLWRGRQQVDYDFGSTSPASATTPEPADDPAAPLP